MKAWVHSCLIAAFLTFGSCLFAGDSAVYRSWMAYFKAHDPIADAQANFQKGEIHVLSAMGAGQYYPGLDHDVGDRIEKKHGVKHLKGMSDAVEGDLHMSYMTAAEKFAAEYNRTTAKLLKEKVP